ncbi:MAG: tetratricopeptide repeat protein [Candidatus Omnitrophota bacterium]
MRTAIKLFIVTAFIVVISFQVLSIAAYAPFDYTPYVGYVEQIEAQLAAAMYPEAILGLRSEDEKSEEKAQTLASQLIKDYEQLEVSPAHKQQAMEEVAMLLYRKKDYEQALIKAKTILEEYPKDLVGSRVLWICYRLKAQTSEKQKNYGKAINEYENILRYPVFDNFEAATYHLIGKLYEKKEDKESAKVSYQHIIDNFPNMNLTKIIKKRMSNLK